LALENLNGILTVHDRKVLGNAFIQEHLAPIHNVEDIERYNVDLNYDFNVYRTHSVSVQAFKVSILDYIHSEYGEAVVRTVLAAF
jgi:hypothetical protein